MNLYQIIYTSNNCITGTPAQIEVEIQSILVKSRENNMRDGITGALLFNGSGFAQVLEGTLAAIDKTFERIQCDERHANVVLLSNQECAERTFSDWSMAYADPTRVRGSELEAIDFDKICSDPTRGAPFILTAMQRLLSS